MINDANNPAITFSVIGPALNEAGNLESYVNRCIEGFRNSNKTFEIIIIDDGSTDNTTEVLAEIKKTLPEDTLRVIKHRRNFGLTEALKSGFDQAKGEFIIWISPDLESLPDEDIPKFIDGFDEGADVVAGARIGRADGKNLASFIYNKFCQTLFGLELRDMNWTKAFKRECLEFIEMRSDWHRFIIVMLHNAGFKIIEKDMNWHRRTYGLYKFGLMRFPISIIDALSVFFFLRFSKHPMRFFGGIGAALSLVGVSIHIYLLGLFLTTGSQIRPLFWGALSLMLLALNLVMFGFVAELIISRQTRPKP